MSMPEARLSQGCDAGAARDGAGRLACCFPRVFAVFRAFCAGL